MKKLWPIRRDELATFLPTFILGFLICLNYFLLRSVKDTLIITAGKAGTAAIPFLKMWGVLPAAVLASILLSFLFRKFSPLKVFYGVVGVFVGYFALFALVLYPGLEPTPDAGVLGVIRQWPLSLFYVMAELWKVVVLMVLFWGFVNRNTALPDAHRFYGPLMVGGSLAGMLGGQITMHVSGGMEWENAFPLLMSIICGVAIVSIGLYTYLSRKLGDQPPSETAKRTSWLASLKTVVRSRPLMCMSLVIICDYVAFNLVELIWKARLYELFPNPADFCSYHAKVVFWTGVAGVFSSLFVTSNVLRRFNWTFLALLTPIALLGTSFAFFSFSMMGMVSAAVVMGAFHNIGGRAARQALADPAKEMAYLPLDPELKTQGKTFVDGMSPAIGKSSASLIQQGLLIGTPGVLATAAVACPLAMVITMVSAAAILGVGKDYRATLSGTLMTERKSA